VRELGIYSPGVFHVRKERIGERDSVGGSMEGNRLGVLRRKAALTGGPKVSATHSEGNRSSARASWAS
jgi:hypothetical protein